MFYLAFLSVIFVVGFFFPSEHLHHLLSLLSGQFTQRVIQYFSISPLSLIKYVAIKEICDTCESFLNHRSSIFLYQIAPAS